MGALFGKPAKSKSTSTSTQTSESGNHAYNDLNQALLPTVNYLSQGGNALASLLGIPMNNADGTAAPDQGAALNQFSNSTGMDFIRNQGVKAIEASQGGKGMFQSGATGKALQSFGQGLGSTFLNQYLQNLFDYSRLGLGGAGVLAGAGGYSNSTGTSNSTSTSKGPKKGIIGDIAGAAVSSAMGNPGGLI